MARSKRLTTGRITSLVDRTAARQLESSRPTRRWTDITAGLPPYRLLWLRLTSGAPADPPDERYYGDEVRPAGTDSAGRLTWETAPGGVEQVVIHNVAEAALHTHTLPVGTIVIVEEQLNRSQPPELAYLAHVPAPAERLARIVSYGSGTYTVQPVRREEGGFVGDGPVISGVRNLGELWTDEAGYMAGPAGFDRYVQIFQTPAGWTMLLHPPRMV